MSENIVIQGRQIGESDLGLIRGLLVQRPDLGRTHLSQELCRLWSWRAANGRLKDMACRTLLLKLHRAGRIELPAPRRPANNGIRNLSARAVSHDSRVIECELRELLPLCIRIIEPQDADADLFKHLLQKYHYLGHRSTVGETIRYLVSDARGRPLSCVLFGAAAWTVRPRDEHIGWTHDQRARKLQWVTNNTRFLVLPWVRVPNLASHILSRICRQLRSDWNERYGHPISAVETFVDCARFRGTCYKAANWQRLGQTSGRTRNGKHGESLRGVKDVYLYALTESFKHELCNEYSPRNITEGTFIP